MACWLEGGSALAMAGEKWERGVGDNLEIPPMVASQSTLRQISSSRGTFNRVSGNPSLVTTCTSFPNKTSTPTV